MGFARAMVRDAGMERESRVGDGSLSAFKITTIATAGDLTVPVAAVQGGIAVYTGAAGAVAYTLPLAADLIAAFPSMDIGDSFEFLMVNTAAQVATITTNTGLTLAGSAVTINAASKRMLFTKTAATTMTVTLL
jgi:hypothetical protein